jgi:hypothetical protein
MEAIAHSPSFAKKAGVPQSVGKDYAAADKGKTFKKGGDMKRMAGGGQLSEKDYQKSQTKLANMREEEEEVQNERQRRADQERYQSYARGIGMTDLRLAKKEGKTYDKWFEDNRKDQLKKGILRKEAYDEGKGFEMLTPAEHRKAMVSGYKKGGDVKESKAMVGKEVAFMKKKGAPAKMIKHEMSEMKGMKAGGKVRKMAEGGLNDMGEGAALSNRSYGYEEEKERGAKNLEGIKNFFGFGKKKDEEAAPIDRSRDKPPPVIRPSMGGPSTSRVSSQSPRTRRETEDTSASDAVEREDAASMDRTTKGPQYTSSINTDGGEYSGDGFFKPAKESRVSPAKEPTRTRRPATVSRTRETTSVTAEPAKGKVPAKIDSEKLLRDAEEEVLRKKPTAMTEQMRKAPTINDLYAGQKSMSDEISDALKSFRASIRRGNRQGKADALNEQSNPPPFDWRERKKNQGKFVIEHAKGGKVKRMRYGGEPDSSMDMGQPMRGVRAPTASPQMPMENIERQKAKMSSVEMPGMMGASAAKMRAQQEAQKMKGVGTGGIDRRSDIGTMGMQPRQKSGIPFEEGKGYGNRGSQPQLPPSPVAPPSYAEDKVPPRSPIERFPQEPKLLPGQKPEELFAEINRAKFNSGMMQPSRPGDSPRIDGPGIKAGGQVKKMAQGGYAKADGVASRGKTQPKMVKMAKGGFVKTADGCAQRGKTKAFQVKMKRGGMC